ncbi:ABC-three component system middle component 1 [Pseudomonas sp. A-RE-26]|uniref:ABC-three component system middle component 1 n=1 Tax=Pseudomonas sp. A-RE-26 TaxID=2832402 RepID=UPI001CBFF7F1|nr:ABC-three component system middle component 1 [Pseudomonas sp. A-RE-26]
MKLLTKEYDFEFLAAEFGDMAFHMFRSDDSLSYISCIACLCKESSVIVKNWRVIQNLVSVHHQPPGNLAVWNVYIAFVTIGTLPIWDKYQIENNKYSARKLIIDGYAELPTVEQLTDCLEEQLLGSDLTLDPRFAETREPLLSLEKFVRGAPLDQKIESKEKRASMINEIIESLNKNENQKG